MNLEKSQKRISKKVKKGFQGYPLITISYFGPTNELATKVVVGFKLDENSEELIEKFSTEMDIREDISVQTTIIKIIDRSGAESVTLAEGITIE